MRDFQPLARSILVALILSWPASSSGRCIPFIPGAASSVGGQVFIAPDGTGPSLVSLGATITVTVWVCPGEPYPAVDVPAQDIWLADAAAGALHFCREGAIADAPTNANGTTTFTGALTGGGWSTAGLQVYLGSTRLGGPLPFIVVSPDLDGNLSVNLGDVGEFAIDFNDGYAVRSDFNFDGRINLADIGTLATYLGVSCP